MADGLAQSYTYSDISNLTTGISVSQTIAVNASHQVLGVGYPTGSSSTEHAYLLNNGTWLDIGALNPASVNGQVTNDIGQLALALNNLGQVVTVGTNGDLFLYANGVSKDLGVPSGATSIAPWGINNSGVIVGNFSTGQVSAEPGSTPNPSNMAFMYANGAFTNLVGTTGDSFAVFSVNNSGEMAGVEQTTTNLSGFIACSYLNGSVTGLGSQVGGTGGCARAVNNNGQIVGIYSQYSVFSPNPNPSLFGFILSSSGTVSNLGSISGGTTYQPRNLNISGQVVGDYLANGAAQHAFIYSNGTIQDLNPLITNLPTGVVISSATGISDDGYIVGSASNSHAFLLAPVGAFTSPSITGQPASQTISTGATVTFSVSAGGTSPTYQWKLNGNPISGATSSLLVISNATAANAGSYTCVVTNPGGSVTSQAASLQITAGTDPGRLINLSILSVIQGSLSMGFVIGGTGTSGLEPLLIRGVGPSIGPGTAFDVPGVITDPTLTVVQQTNHAVVASNSGWGTPASNVPAVQTADAATGAFALTNPSSLDSAVVSTLPSVGGGYSATVAGKSGDNGYALTEVYDDTANYTITSTRLINLSCLTQIATGGTLDVGFVIGGTTSKTVLIRVGGPALATLYGVGGVMPDPQLKVSPLSNSSTVLAFNAGWGGNSQIVSVAASVGAYPFPSPSSLDSAVLVTLPPGAFTVQVNSASGLGGTVLVEIYDVL